MFPTIIFDTSFCRLRLVSNPNSSSVYEVTFYSQDDENRRDSTFLVNINDRRRTIVVKLPHTNDLRRNTNEIKALKMIKDLHASDYVIGIQEFDVANELNRSYALQQQLSKLL